MTKVLTYTRWMRSDDIDKVAAIEAENFEQPWERAEIVRQLRKKNIIGYAVDYDNTLIGYAFYCLRKKSIEILSVAIKTDFHRQGIGTQVINKLKNKLNPNGRDRLYTLIRERNVAAQLFFVANGFSCYNVRKRYYDDGEDAYDLEYWNTQ